MNSRTSDATIRPEPQNTMGEYQLAIRLHEIDPDIQPFT
jgi:hypothetical protein